MEKIMINTNTDKILCESCPQHSQEEIKAVRFCQRCNICLCNDCLIEEHSDHIGEAKIKIEEFITTRGKDEVRNFKTKIEDKKKEIWACHYEEKTEIINKKIEETFVRTTKEIEMIKGKLDGLLDLEVFLRNLARLQLQIKLEGNMNNPQLNNINSKIKEVDRLVNNWDRSSKNERIKFLKEKNNIEQEINDEIEILKKSKGSNLDTAVNLTNEVDFYTKRNFNNEFYNIEKILAGMFSLMNKIKEDILKNRPHSPRTNITNPNISISPKVNKPKDNTQIVYPSTNTPTIQAEFKYLITHKKPRDVLILNPSVDSDRATSVTITDSCFLDGRPIENFPPEYSKFINLGDSILITGGVSRTGTAQNECYFLKVSQDNYNNYNVIITQYSPMNEKRERHNIIYLDDIESVLVCGGFYTKTSEIVNINKGEWNYLSLMKDQRANATMLYYNHHTVYCFGGFHVGEKSDRSNPGSYLGTCEFIDVKHNNPSWSFINLESVYGISSFKFCAMGIIHLTPQRILLVGGYDGTKYLSEVYELNFEKDNISSIVSQGKKNGILKGAIFPSSSKFIQWGENFLNYDFNCRIVQYITKDRDFIVKS